METYCSTTVRGLCECCITDDALCFSTANVILRKVSVFSSRCFVLQGHFRPVPIMLRYFEGEFSDPIYHFFTRRAIREVNVGRGLLCLI